MPASGVCTPVRSWCAAPQWWRLTSTALWSTKTTAPSPIAPPHLQVGYALLQYPFFRHIKSIDLHLYVPHLAEKQVLHTAGYFVETIKGTFFNGAAAEPQLRIKATVFGYLNPASVCRSNRWGTMGCQSSTSAAHTSPDDQCLYWFGVWFTFLFFSSTTFRSLCHRCESDVGNLWQTGVRLSATCLFLTKIEMSPLPMSLTVRPSESQPTPKPKAAARSRHPSYPPCQRSPGSRPLPSTGRNGPLLLLCFLLCHL